MGGVARSVEDDVMTDSIGTGYDMGKDVQLVPVFREFEADSFFSAL